jgi:metal-responsive CopG/Arc/MetJ family transcriptional regulator
MADERKRERVVVLFSKAELKKIDSYCKANKIANRSDFFRQLVLGAVESDAEVEATPV